MLFIPGPRMALVPKKDFRIVDNWHVTGLCGTGSKEVYVESSSYPIIASCRWKTPPPATARDGSTRNALLQNAYLHLADLHAGRTLQSGWRGARSILSKT